MKGASSFVYDADSANWTPLRLVYLIASIVIGSFLGAALSFIVNATLVEISLDPFFELYFGVIFIIVGGGILYRLTNHPALGERKIFLMIFASLVILSGLLCIFFNPDWFFTLSAGAKIPIYSLIGMSTCFAVTFSLLDLINLCIPIIDSVTQIYIILAVSIFMGIGYGFLFGLYDVGKNVTTGSELGRQLGKEELRSLPLGFFLGALGAGLNELFRGREERAAATHKYAPIFENEEDV